MATRTPTSILVLIDRRNRLAGELKKLSSLKDEVTNLHRHVETSLQQMAEALEAVAGRYDQERIRVAGSLKRGIGRDYGRVTRLIIGALKAAQGRPLTSMEISDWACNNSGLDGQTLQNDGLLRLTIRKRLKSLRAQGTVVSPVIGNGYSTQTTWLINPDLITSGLDTESTLFHDDDLGSSRRTTEKDHNFLDDITHSIFYTAVTRARERLKIFWTPETQQSVLGRLKRHVNHKDVSLLSSRRGLRPERG